jgi:uncharacterized protein with HEPN domain
VKDDLFYVEHILECIEKIDKFTRGGEAEFFGSELIQDAVLRNLQILAESTKRLTEIVKAATPSIEWSAVIGFRTVLVHEPGIESGKCMADRSFGSAHASQASDGDSSASIIRAVIRV